MNEFSMDRMAEQIYHRKTKEYFQEVLSSYVNENYRSAVVMLYSVVIADLFYKLRELEDRDDDEKAICILKEIREELAKKDRKNKSEWEIKIVEEVFKRTNLLETMAKTNIDALKNHRNLAAHPILDNDEVLSVPNKDNTRSHIRNMLEGVLTKPSYHSKKIAEEFMSKIPNMWWEFSDEDYERYIIKRYFSFFNNKTIKLLFRFLWKTIFKVSTDDAKESRAEYYQTLMILNNHFPEIMKQYVNDELSKFNDIALNERKQLKYYLKFLFYNKHLFSFVSESNRIWLNNELKTKPQMSVFAWFNYESTLEHFNDIRTKLKLENKSPTYHKYMYELAVENIMTEKLFDFFVEMLSITNTFKTGQTRWGKIIRPYLRYYSEANIKNLLNTLNKNRFLYNAYWVSDYLWDIKNETNLKLFNLESYENLPEIDEDQD